MAFDSDVSKQTVSTGTITDVTCETICYFRHVTNTNSGGKWDTAKCQQGRHSYVSALLTQIFTCWFPTCTIRFEDASTRPHQLKSKVGKYECDKRQKLFSHKLFLIKTAEYLQYNNVMINQKQNHVDWWQGTDTHRQTLLAVQQQTEDAKYK